MSNTLIDLRQQLQSGSVAQGWGAIMVLSRSRLNRLLEQEYIASFGMRSHMPLINGEVALDESGNDIASLHNVQLGAPQLSFSSASLTDSRAQLSMPIIAGQFLVVHASPGAARTVTRSFDIKQSQGYWLQVQIDLKMVEGHVDQLGVVAVDLSSASTFRCDLASDDPYISQRLGALFQSQLQELRDGQGLFRLGVLDRKHYGLLAPKSFRILTQSAPGAQVAGALNWGDGAVVVLIGLQADRSEGALPLRSGFPYLIPSDRDDNGQERFSATLLLGQPMRVYLEGNQPPLFSKLRFTAGAVYRPLAEETTHDLVSFGSIDSALGNLQLEPAFSVLPAGRSLNLRLIGGDNPTWEVVSLEGRTPQSHGTISNGRYTAPNAATVGEGTLNVVVTARVGTGAEQRAVSALIQVVYDSMAVAPRVAEYAYHSGQPIRLGASSLDRFVQWGLRGNALGQLQANGLNGASFVPGPGLGRRSIQAQRLEAEGDQTQPASLLLASGQQLLGIEPYIARRVRHASHVQLHDDRSLLPGLARRWQVLGGGGEVDQQGLFTVPDQTVTADSVVLCEIVHNDIVFSSGYSVIQRSESSEPKRWKELSRFTVKLPGFSNGGQGNLFANGYQQLQVEIEVQTSEVDGEYLNISENEKRSIRLRELDSGQDVPWFANLGGQPDTLPLGMEEDDRVQWRTRELHNGFEMSIVTQPMEMPVLDTGLTRKTVYLHSLAAGNTTVKLIAVLKQDDTHLWFDSLSEGEANGTLTVSAKSQPVYLGTDYSLVRKRIWGNEPPPSTNPPPNDEFDYHLQTLDYWVLGPEPGRADFQFKTLRFVDSNGRDDAGEIVRSIIRWESDGLWEQMFSWTGWAFSSDVKRGEDSQGKVLFDEDLSSIVKAGSAENDERKLDLVVDPQNPTGHTLVITLHRSDRVDFVPKASSAHAKPGLSAIRDRLATNLNVILRDQRGNLHKRKITFLDKGAAPGSRNQLKQTHIGDR